MMDSSVAVAAPLSVEPLLDQLAQARRAAQIARGLQGVALQWVRRNIAALELPAKLFGKGRFKTGDTIALASTFYTHGRAYRVEWKGNFTLSPKR